MRFVDEYRDPVAARALVAQITALAGEDEFKFMEVCGGQTHAIIRHGIDQLLPAEVELIHGPGCPVCVTPLGMIDKAKLTATRLLLRDKLGGHFSYGISSSSKLDPALVEIFGKLGISSRRELRNRTAS